MHLPASVPIKASESKLISELRRMFPRDKNAPGLLQVFLVPWEMNPFLGARRDNKPASDLVTNVTRKMIKNCIGNQMMSSVTILPLLAIQPHLPPPDTSTCALRFRRVVSSGRV